MTAGATPADRAPHDPPPALALAGVGKRFGASVALHDVSLTVRPGTVHALLGENGAGKTTLMRIAYGMTAPDAGQVAVHGVPRRFHSPADAIAAGIGMVHQHFTLVPAMTVAENIALGGRGAFSAREAERRVRAVAEGTGFALDGQATAGALPVGAQQRVEIAKALSRDARILVLDEPTGVLAPAEVDDLLRWLRAFVARGHAAVLITHKLREALAVADDVTVLRRGQRAWTGRAADTDAARLTAAMIGERVAGASVARPASTRPAADAAPAVFRADAITVRDEAGVVRVRDASFTIAAGELVGVVGVERSGQRELLRALAGRLPISGGRLERPADVGFVPEDRHADAVLLARSLVENVALRGLGRARGRMRWREWRARTRALVDAFDVRTGSAESPMRALSGGNQQKLVLARELDRTGDDFPMTPMTAAAGGAPPEEQGTVGNRPDRHPSHARGGASAPRAIVVESPTRGLDVHAAAAVQARLVDAAARGAAVVVYDGDLDEVLAIAARVLVVFDGRVREVGTDRDAIGRAMLGLP